MPQSTNSVHPSPELTSILMDAAIPIRQAVSDGRLPGAALGVVTADGHHGVFVDGRLSFDPGDTPVTPDTWFDLASLTKVMVTVPQCLKLVESGAIDLDDPIGRHLPDLNQTSPNAPVRALTIRALLSHNAGLVPVAPLYTWAAGSALRAAILQYDWVLGDPAYSDIGYILLGLMIERLTGRAFCALPVGTGLAFAPPAAETAATEVCPWRGRLIRGEVHDENACALGGAAGHAGLFGTIVGVLTFALQNLTGAALSPAAMAAMRAPQSSHRALGWERPHPLWTGGSLCSASTLGHNGFTGTGLWIDFERGYAWSLLSNRVHPSRHRDTGIMALRRAFANRLAAGVTQSGRLPRWTKPLDGWS